MLAAPSRFLSGYSLAHDGLSTYSKHAVVSGNRGCTPCSRISCTAQPLAQKAAAPAPPSPRAFVPAHPCPHEHSAGRVSALLLESLTTTPSSSHCSSIA